MIPIVLVASILCVAASPAPPAGDAVEAVIASEMAARHIPGLALAVVRGGRILKEGYYGRADLENDVPVQAGTVFPIASMSKAFTAAAVMLLVEDGKLALDDHVSRYLPDAPPSWSEITLRQLLDHTSGIPEDWRTHPPADDGKDAFFLRVQSDAAFLRELYAQPLDFAPGTDSRYSCGPFVLGVVVGKVSGMPYALFMHERIFKPLGLDSTSINDLSAIVPHRSAGYALSPTGMVRGPAISPAAAARGDVGVITTARDMAAWWIALRGGRLLKGSSLAQVFAPSHLASGAEIPAGLGWFIEPVAGRPRIGHGGSFRTGFNSFIASYPADDLTVIVLTNLVPSRAGAIAARVAGTYVPAYAPIATRAPQPDPDAPRTTRLGHALSAAAHHVMDRTTMTPSFPLDYFDDDARDQMAAVTGLTYLGEESFAAPVPLLGAAVTTVVYFRLDGPQPAYTAFSLTADGKVAYIDYLEE